MEYDFSKLNDREFETLGASIVEKISKKRVEKFKAGRDGGVDGRFWIGKKKRRYYPMQALRRNAI